MPARRGTPAGDDGLPLDELTPAIIEARKAVALFEGPVAWIGPPLPPSKDRIEEALWQRIARGAGLSSRLILVEQPRFARHPLREEGVRLRARLTQIHEEASSERKRRHEEQIEFHRRRNAARIPTG